ncbi:shikimate kinase [Microcella frigidaquae]|uniref:Shikimate kinase n=1 Tax=Microcella frigidaquae TaxID=424758 RepID=A0A840X671_9MICO|nr:shikimate kinase [Microcella frigidaquae]
MPEAATPEVPGQATTDAGNRPLVVLIGPPAAGKTRTGKRVARALAVPFIDTDRVIAAEHGPIPAIFAERGEAAFRALEADAVDAALRQRAVVALGGGAVMTPSVAAALRGHPVVLLTVSAEAAADRLDAESRPLVRDGIGAWESLVAQRMPTYTALATAAWDTSSQPLDRVAAEIAEWARDRAAAAGGS